ncbi:T9SS type A sorting domain-containing protein [Flavilitoribacter nigricans]|uniref:Ig-like domain-containing protein n=1 Tax=Flavilitoribacter nigricans (strain ATCC 23147 / DSM 23189 / NBRC 102662 / NCIMB 1420 / SS-2) TaxID=1122177 RepID=A0A2D0N725_FLAN2|nr:T9SS type A sorting domain-containing protein [Flavilitoribacter nigricans]PHN03939.1 hypothetical protein CRP01_24010 [Flavilitoribacter nigricans DSM 23189 = NBRC 102662]
MNFSLYLSLTGWLLAWFSYFINHEQNLNAALTQEQITFECDQEFVCNGSVTVDLSGAPEDTTVIIRISDLMPDFETKFAPCKDEIYFHIQWAWDLPLVQDSLVLDCKAYSGKYKYVIADGYDDATRNGNDCWGYITIENYPHPICRKPVEDSLQLVNFYDKTGGNAWDMSWDLTQPMSSWYGVEVNEEGFVKCIDLDGVNDCAYTENGNGNNLVGGELFLDLPALEFLSVANNAIEDTRLFYSKLPEAEAFYFSNNRVDTVLDFYNFSRMPNLRELRIDCNRLSFDDILFSIDTLTAITSANGGSFVYSPQQLVYESERSVDQPDVDITIDLGVDDTVSTNVYTWYKNDELFQVVNGVNTLQLEEVWSPTAGHYRCEITNEQAPELVLMADYYLTVDYIENCPQLICSGMYTVDMSQVPDQSSLTFRLQDMIFTENGPYTGPCASSPLEFYLSIGGERFYNSDGSDSIVLDCDYFTGSFKYAVEDTVANSGNNCWGFVQLQNLESFTCQTPARDSLSLVDFYNSSGGPDWTNSWDLTQPMSSWYGVGLNEDGLVECLDLDGVWDCAYSPDGGGNNLVTGPWNFEMENLKFLSLANNRLSRTTWFKDNFPELLEFYFSNNQLSTLADDEDFYNMPRLKQVRLDRNQLTFEDLLPQTSFIIEKLTSEGGQFIYGPQARLYRDTVILEDPGQDLLIDLDIDAAISNNVYTWYKDGTIIETNTGNGQFIIDDIQFSDVGIYRCEVTNLFAPDLTLETYPIELQVRGNPWDQCRLTDSLALVALYDAANGPQWTNSWDLNTPIVSWYGVGFNENGCVASLALPGNGLRGSLPDLNLPNLSTLDLSGNELRGGGMFSNLPLLTTLDLSDNRFTFESILPNLGVSNFDYTVQAAVYPDTLLEAYELGNITFDLMIDAAVASNNYKWYRDGQLVHEAVGDNKLVLNELYTFDSGTYTCEITNPNAPGLTLTTGEIELIVYVPCRAADSLMLVDLYQSTNGPSWKTSWDLNAPINSWYGVELNEQGCVTSIQLLGNNLSGTLPDLSFSALERLHLSTNQIGGTIPDFSDLPALKRLELSQNRLSGPIPDFDLPNLTVLSLNGNELSGTIPDFSDIPIMSNLHLDDNDLEGSIPHFSNMAELNHLGLSRNNLSGTIPNFSAFPDLYTINFSHNALEGCVPNFANLPSLQTIDLTNNQLECLVPSFPAAMGLVELSLSYNYFSFEDILPHIGELEARIAQNGSQGYHVYSYDSQKSRYDNPSQTGTLGQSLVIDLMIDENVADNHHQWYKDGVPFQEITGINELVFESLQFADEGVYHCVITNPGAPDLSLELSGTQVQVAEPTCRTLDSLALVQLYEATNGADWTNSWDLNQPIDTWYGVGLNENGCVTCLDLDGSVNCEEPLDGNTGNNLTGSIPDLQLPNLRVLNLSYNKLSGAIPDFSDLANLSMLALTRNQLSGSIPDFSNLPELEIFVANLNGLEGPLPGLTAVPKLRMLMLASNQLSGAIPAINGLPALASLGLEKNAFIGTIPDLSSAPDLYHLNLANNQLDGVIPSFAGLPKLANIILANNELSGSIPDLGHLSQLSQLDLANNQLSGCLPDLSANLYLNQLTVQNNELSCTEGSLAGATALKNVRLEGNKFTFEDLLPLRAPAPTTFQYAPQQEFFSDTLIRGAYESSLTIDLGIDQEVSANVYEWYQDGEIRETVTGNNQLTFPVLSFADNGVYHSIVTNAALPDLQLKSRTITLAVTPPNCRASDSLSLVLFYQIMGGPGWDNTWDLQAPLDSWYGVSMDEQLGCVTALNLSGNGVKGQLSGLRNWDLARLTQLDLSGNEMTGAIPEFTGLSRLEDLDLSGNLLRGNLPGFNGQPALIRLNLMANDLSGLIPAYEHLTQLQELQLANNRFTFEDILPNADQLSADSYVPQQPLPHRAYYKLVEHQSLTFDLVEDDEVQNNRYQWYKDSVAWRQLQGVNELYFDSLKISDTGKYYCHVTNPAVPDLVLTTGLITLIVEENLMLEIENGEVAVDPDAVPMEHEEGNSGLEENGRISVEPTPGQWSTATGNIQPLQLKLFPNPANYRARLLYSLPEATTVSLQLVDANGRMVQMLQPAQWQSAGVYQLSLELDQLPAGVYVVHLITDTGKSYERLVITR